MPAMLIATCPLCGLRYANRPLLELHIREDHRPRRRHAVRQPRSGRDPSPQHSERSTSGDCHGPVATASIPTKKAR